MDRTHELVPKNAKLGEIWRKTWKLGPNIQNGPNLAQYGIKNFEN